MLNQTAICQKEAPCAAVTLALNAGEEMHVTTTAKDDKPADSLIDTVVALENASSSQVKGFVYFKTRGEAIDCGKLISILDSKSV